MDAHPTIGHRDTANALSLCALVLLVLCSAGCVGFRRVGDLAAGLPLRNQQALQSSGQAAGHQADGDHREFAAPREIRPRREVDQPLKASHDFGNGSATSTTTEVVMSKRTQQTPQTSKRDAQGTDITAMYARRRENSSKSSAPNRIQLAQFEEVQLEDYLPEPVQIEPRVPAAMSNVVPVPSNVRRIPVGASNESSMVDIQSSGELISIKSEEATLNEILSEIATAHGLNIMVTSDANVPVTITLNQVPLQDALDIIVGAAGCSWVKQKNIIVVSGLGEESQLSPFSQGRTLRVFDLNFISAVETERVIQGLLSPVGHVFISEVDAKNNKKTQERIVVEDLPEYMNRIESYIAQIDHPPRQVLIEAHVLQVELEDELRHGINFDALANVAGTDINIGTFALPSSAGPLTPFFIDLDGGDLDAIVDAVRTTTDAKTLASPKVLVLNGQEAKIQIGERLGFLVTTTTQTATLQNVEFLDVGVILTVTPTISNDGQVLLTVKPEISTGAINPNTGLPDSNTTEVETSVLLPDGRGIVIGGLIQEADNEDQSKIPLLGDIKLLGKLFRYVEKKKERTEIVIALVPRIVPYDCEYMEQDKFEYQRATTRLLEGPLRSVDRPEPRLPDAIMNPRSIRYKRPGPYFKHLRDPGTYNEDYYFPYGNEGDVGFYGMPVQPEYYHGVETSSGFPHVEPRTEPRLEDTVIFEPVPYDE